MFDLVEPKYNAFTFLFSYGMDARWKRRLLSLAGQRHFPVVLDLACGTGDLLDQCLRVARVDRAIGIDLSFRMALATNKRTRPLGARAILGDLAALPIESRSVDLVTVGYGFRNAAQFDEALQEAYRVLRPGGMLLVLDFYRPSSRVWDVLFRRYLSIAGALYGLLFHREAAVYAYLARSIHRYLTTTQFEHALRSLGFNGVMCKQHLFGGIALHSATKPAT